MGRKVEMVMFAAPGSLPGYEMLVTDAAREVADRPQFKASGISGHVYVNGYDLARVESAGLRDRRIGEALLARGWYTNTDAIEGAVWWFKRNDPTHAIHSLADAVLDCLALTPTTEEARDGE